MSDETFPRVIWSGTFRLFGVDLLCHSLDNGQRVIDADSMDALLEAVAAVDDEAGDATLDDAGALADWMKGKA